MADRSLLRWLPVAPLRVSISSLLSLWMQAFTEVLEDDDESEASVLGNKDQTMFGYSATREPIIQDEQH